MHKTTGLAAVGILFLALLAGNSSLLPAASDAGLKVYSASTVMKGDTYFMDAQLGYNLSQAALDALDSGVPLTFELEVDIYTPRKWLWNKTLLRSSHRYQVVYHALSQQYIVTNINSGIQNNYSRRNTALLSMGRINDVPLVEQKALPESDAVMVRLRVSLLIDALPSPMRPWAYINSDWLLASEWFKWELK